LGSVTIGNLFSLFILLKAIGDKEILPMVHLARQDTDALRFAYRARTPARRLDFGVRSMWALNMHGFLHWFAANGIVCAVVVTVGVAVFLACSLGCCTSCPKREKDDLFRRREI
jgi:hypothetical protein